jgi:hypothetical protein
MIVHAPGGGGGGGGFNTPSRMMRIVFFALAVRVAFRVQVERLIGKLPLNTAENCHWSLPVLRFTTSVDVQLAVPFRTLVKLGRPI